MNFIGADPEQLRDASRMVRSTLSRLNEIRETLTGSVSSVDWQGPDAQNFREAVLVTLTEAFSSLSASLALRSDQLTKQADEQDLTSSYISLVGEHPLSRHERQLIDSLPLLEGLSKVWDPLESDGFWSDFIGSTESGKEVTEKLAWTSFLNDLAGTFGTAYGGPVGAVTDGANTAMDGLSIITGSYDALQSFQDGEAFGTADGLITAGINTMDLIATGVSYSPFPVVREIGMGVSLFTGGLDSAWSLLTVAALEADKRGGPGDGSATKFFLTAPSYYVEELTGIPAYSEFWEPATQRIDDVYSVVTGEFRAHFPIIDPLIDSQQILLEETGERLRGEE